MPPPSDAAAQAAERQQREQQDRLREQFRRDRERTQLPPAENAPLPLPAIQAPPVVRREIRRLDLEGADHMNARFRAQLVSEYEGRSVGVEDLEQLLTEITRYYVFRGYVTTRAYVPDQDLSTGTLRIRVVEGRLEGLEEARTAGNIFPVAPGELLNLRDLEQGIDNLNRLPSHHATLDLVPGTQSGGTVVRIHDERTKPWHLNVSADNTGSETTGRNQASATLAFDDLFGLGEAMSVTHRRAVPYRSGREASESTNASISVPWGYQSFTLGGSTSSYAMEFAAPSGSALPFTGDSKMLFLRADRVLLRRQTGSFGAYANLTWKSSRNYLMRSLIGVSSRDSVLLDVGVNCSTTFAGGFASVEAGLLRGLPIFGALHDPAGLPGYAPRSEYSALKLSTSWSRPFRLAGLPFSFSSSLTAQYTPDVLYGADQLTIGGLYAVRGFDATNLAGDAGYVWRNDLSVVVPLVKDASGGSRLTLRPYVGFDHGHAWSNVSGVPGVEGPTGTLLGGAIGAGLTTRRCSVDVFYARSIQRATGMPAESGRVYFRFNASL